MAREVGLSVSNISTEEKRYIVESMSGSAGAFDCDNDFRALIERHRRNSLANDRGTSIEPFRLRKISLLQAHLYPGPFLLALDDRFAKQQFLMPGLKVGKLLRGLKISRLNILIEVTK
jgi:hypothetical protein